ncbi:receptor-type tyrosine-protein phosphatase epsilon-like isoform X2 [Apostichopus japonicus]|uniref:receptor-type tyrosine-protein phosphatase epsilon-like isoform X2 n=1 Tax=Stichopus japonicus TaxID=307972 RepID=UPI003AB2E78D
MEEKDIHVNIQTHQPAIKAAGVTRQGNNWHFETWPDMDVPHQATPLIGLANKVKLYQVTYDGPPLVHCSAGVGRTGTFIGLYSLMDVIQTRLRIDAFGYVEQMRQSRIMMVQTAAQFRFLHECLLEFYLSGDTVISAKDIASFSIHDNREKLVREYSLLAKFDKRLKKANEVLPEEADKSRFPSLLPGKCKTMGRMSCQS